MRLDQIPRLVQPTWTNFLAGPKTPDTRIVLRRSRGLDHPRVDTWSSGLGSILLPDLDQYYTNH